MRRTLVPFPSSPAGNLFFFTFGSVPGPRPGRDFSLFEYILPFCFFESSHSNRLVLFFLSLIRFTPFLKVIHQEGISFCFFFSLFFLPRIFFLLLAHFEFLSTPVEPTVFLNTLLEILARVPPTAFLFFSPPDCVFFLFPPFSLGSFRPLPLLFPPSGRKTHFLPCFLQQRSSPVPFPFSAPEMHTPFLFSFFLFWGTLPPLLRRFPHPTSTLSLDQLMYPSPPPFFFFSTANLPA